MKYWVLICLLSTGCAGSKKINFTKSTFERFIELSSNEIKDVKVTLLTQDNNRIQFARLDIIKLFDQQMKTTDSYSAKRELKREIDYLKSAKDDFQIKNVGLCCTTLPDGLDSWVVHDLLLAGKAEVWLNGTERVYRIRYVFHEDLLGGETGIFYDMNKKALFSSIIALGE